MTGFRVRTQSAWARLRWNSTTWRGLCQHGFAGCTFNTAWRMVQLLEDRANAGSVTKVSQTRMSETFAVEACADGVDVSVIGRGFLLIPISA